MVLAELGQRISRALGSLNSVTVVDEAVSCRPTPLPATRSCPLLVLSLHLRITCITVLVMEGAAVP